MNLSRRRKLSSHVETSSMNDIMFFLMLFFLIVSTMVNPSVIKLLLPNGKSAKVSMKKTINVSIQADGSTFVDRTPVAPGELENAIKSRIQDAEQTTVVLRVDKSLNVQKLVDVLEVGNLLKVKMVMATAAESKG